MITRRTSNRLKAFCSNKTGTATLEMGILLPILILLMGGMAEFGRAFQQYHVANKGVKNAARYLSRIPTGVDCTTSTGVWNAKTEVTLAKNLAVSGTFSASATPLISNWTPADVTIPAPTSTTCFDNTTDIYLGEDMIPIIRVETSFEFDDIGLLSFIGVGQLVSGNKRIIITASHEEVYIGG